MVFEELSWIPSHSERETIAMISLYHLMISSPLSPENFGKLTDDGPLIFRAVILSSRVLWAMVARLEASDWREVTVVVSAVMRDEFWSRMRFCWANRAQMLGSNGGGGIGWCRDEDVG